MPVDEWQRKTEQLKVRLDPADLARLRDGAQRAGMPVSAYVAALRPVPCEVGASSEDPCHRPAEYLVVGWGSTARLRERGWRLCERHATEAHADGCDEIMTLERRPCRYDEDDGLVCVG
jgi:hypothetical protein